jgi:predicted AAA+ superfamily ATPase
MERLINQYRNLLARTDTSLLRYLHPKINWENRIIAILGARGVGKTTLLLQHIKLHNDLNKSLYISVDDFYFASNRLFDLASTFYQNGGENLFIDEIHKYPDWSKEVKMMHDNFLSLKIVITGSSILELFKGTDDLSRRVVRYELQGFSFREYLNLKLNLNFRPSNLEEILKNEVDLQGVEFPLMHFKNYLVDGYYPFSSEPNFLERLNNVLNLTIESDIPIFAKMNVNSALKMKHLLSIVAQSVPFKPNFTKIAELVGVHRNQIVEYFHYFEKAGLIMQVRDTTKGIRQLGKVDKIYLENTNLMYAISSKANDIGNRRETFFLNQMRINHKVFSSKIVDFQMDDFLFEIGGKSKTMQQIKELDQAFIVKDEIEFGYQNTIPLWTFGMNY